MLIVAFRSYGIQQYIIHKSGVRGPEAPAKKLFSVCFGGFAAKTNRKQYNLGGATPPYASILGR